MTVNKFVTVYSRHKWVTCSCTKLTKHQILFLNYFHHRYNVIVGTFPPPMFWCSTIIRSEIHLRRDEETEKSFKVFFVFLQSRHYSHFMQFVKSGDIVFTVSHSVLLHVQYRVCISENTPLMGLLGSYSGKHSVQQEICNWSWRRWGRLTEKMNYRISVQNNSWNATNITGPVIPNTDRVFKGGFSFTEQSHYSVSSDENKHKGWNWRQRGRGGNSETACSWLTSCLRLQGYVVTTVG